MAHQLNIMLKLLVSRIEHQAQHVMGLSVLHFTQKTRKGKIARTAYLAILKYKISNSKSKSPQTNCCIAILFLNLACKMVYNINTTIGQCIQEQPICMILVQNTLGYHRTKDVGNSLGHSPSQATWNLGL